MVFGSQIRDMAHTSSRRFINKMAPATVCRGGQIFAFTYALARVNSTVDADRAAAGGLILIFLHLDAVGRINVGAGLIPACVHIGARAGIKLG